MKFVATLVARRHTYRACQALERGRLKLVLVKTCLPVVSVTINVTEDHTDSIPRSSFPSPTVFPSDGIQNHLIAYRPRRKEHRNRPSMRNISDGWAAHTDIPSRDQPGNVQVFIHTGLRVLKVGISWEMTSVKRSLSLH